MALIKEGNLVPVQERMMYLWAVGYPFSDIAAMLNDEFRDIVMTSVTPNQVRKAYENNMEAFEKARNEITMQCREELQVQVAHMFHRTSAVEIKTVDVFVKKLNSILTQLEDLDTSDIGEKEVRAKFFSLLEAAERIQSRIAKIAGTDAFRDIEVYRQKMQLALEAKGNEKQGALPALRDATPTTWVD